MIRKKVKVNEKDNNRIYPLFWIYIENNIEIVQLLIDYANKNYIKLELIRKQNEYETNSFLWTCS
ncbi:hypothetical protein PIROE2DRAFT_7062 [Piromyces sp. E2]|nr:hypothetical protein PIROE2DRAFT_7062 [Piromyces sp. E2]|eukprot:OUM65819.1 hypothetical protein PIROE2DRAFT_7062 [Piromyces sp. E2]